MTAIATAAPVPEPASTVPPLRPVPDPKRDKSPVSVSTHAGLDAQLAAATDEVLVSSTLSARFGDPTTVFRRVDHENLRRGVRYRVLFPDRARTAPALAGRLHGLALAGAEVRTVPDVPTDAVVLDGTVAVLAAQARPDRGGIALFRLPGVVGTTAALFDRVWGSGVPLAAGDVPESGELTERERELLGLLCSGGTDECAAARLGISVRTVRRMVAGIMHRLGARSRFQAGVKAADRGWLAGEWG